MPVHSRIFCLYHPNPLLGLQPEQTNKTLDRPVDLEGDVDDEGGKMPDETAEGAEGDGGDPKEGNVGDHEELGVSAAAQDALGEHR